MKTKVKTHILLMLLVFASCAWAQQPAAKPTFGIGSTVDQYPEVEWIKGKPVTKFDPEKTYLIECWASWCGPCIEAIPHLNELYQKFKDKIVFVGQAVADQKERMVAVVEEQGANMAYPIAYDHQKDFDRKWLKPAGITSIPRTLVIQNNRVVWTPHPDQMSAEILQLLVDRKFDPAVAEALDPSKIYQHITDLIEQKKDYQKAMSMVDSILHKKPYDDRGLELKGALYQKMDKPVEALAYFQKKFEENPTEKVKRNYYRTLRINKKWEYLDNAAKTSLNKNPGDYASISALLESTSEMKASGGFKAIKPWIDRFIAANGNPVALRNIADSKSYFPELKKNADLDQSLFKAAEKSLSIDPDNLDFIHRLVRRAWENNDKNAAIKLAENTRDALSKKPSKQKLTNILTELLASLKKDILPTKEQFKLWSNELLQSAILRAKKI
ncbi:redoxin family protein [Pedobacter nanyangensis]|uniref:redoxin family protein n=1 Tax=Pedobacter nanyangensis TaxID=1562389 RepID=UPI000DE51F7E|nr:thioredoxin-like domain-containing protein [Pedobacter nanyangensis]